MAVANVAKCIIIKSVTVKHNINLIVHIHFSLTMRMNKTSKRLNMSKLNCKKKSLTELTLTKHCMPYDLVHLTVLTCSSNPSYLFLCTK